MNVAFVSQYPKSPKVDVFLYGQLLYSCRNIIPVFVFLAYFMDEIHTLKNLCSGLNQSQTYIIFVYSNHYCIGELV